MCCPNTEAKSSGAFEIRARGCSMWTSVLIGVASSFVASVVFALIGLLIKAYIQKVRANRFTGTCQMFERGGLQPSGGTVKLERGKWWEDLQSFAPSITVFAEHGTGRAPGTEDWTAVVEVSGHSATATGYYAYQNREGGSLRFELTNSGNEIIEYGTPFDPKFSPFIKRLKRMQ